jgi:hypothetical protein
MNGLKIADNSVVVKTNTNYDFMPIPTRLGKYPSDKIAFCLIAGSVYSSPPIVLLTTGEHSTWTLIDANLKIISVTQDKIDVLVEIDGQTDTVSCNADGSVGSGTKSIRIRDGRETVVLSEYLNDHPLEFKTTDDCLISGHEICSGNPDAISYSSDSIVEINWENANVDINTEFGSAKNGLVSIHDAIKNILMDTYDCDFILYDHGSGEIADFVMIKNEQSTINVSLLHIKSMKGKAKNSSLDDIYEVTQQAIKSTIWLKSRQSLLEKIRTRRKAGHCILEKGAFGELEKALKSQKLFRGKMIIVQPAISKRSEMPLKFQEVLAAAQYYIMQSGRIETLEIWGSE